MNDISLPILTTGIDGLHLDWLPEHLKCDVTAIYQHHDGCIACEIHITTSAEGFNPHLLRHHISDLANATGRDRLANLLKRSYNHVPWEDFIEQVSEFTIRHLRQTPTAVSTFDFMDSKPPEFIIWPFLLKHENNMLFAPGGSGKSNLVLTWLILLELAMVNNPYGWILRNQSSTCLYLDWERSYNTQAWRMRGLLAGLDLPAAHPPTPLHYYRLHAPLVQEVRNVQALINEHSVSVLICDSCGMAAGGDMNKTEPAIQFFGALGALRAHDGQPLTNILISHTSKDITTNRKTPYGNAYWGFECSNIWEIIPSEDQEHNLKTLRLHCFKHNDYGWIPDMGLQVEYQDDAIIYSTCQITELPQGQGHEYRILEVLDEPKKPSEIAKLTGLDSHLVSVMLDRMAKNGSVKHGGGYGLWEKLST